MRLGAFQVGTYFNGENQTLSAHRDRIIQALDSLRIELPSWGFANTGTRFGKFLQAEAAATIEEKFTDAAQVNALTGATPTLALHVAWDLPDGLRDAHKILDLQPRDMASAPAPSIPISLRARNTSTDRSAIPIRGFAGWRLIICWNPWRSRRRCVPAMSLCGLRMVPITRARRASAGVSGGWPRRSRKSHRTPRRRSAAAGRVQAF